MSKSRKQRLLKQLRQQPREKIVEKSDKRESVAQNPLASAFQSVNNLAYGLRKPGTQINMETLKRMSLTNVVDRACISTLRDEVTSLKWTIAPINPKEPIDTKFRDYITRLLNKPNRNKENWRTLIDKVMEDVLVYDAGVIEKVRNGRGMVAELWHVDGSTIKPVFDEHGVAGDPAYQQFLPNQKDNTPVAEFKNEDMIYMLWNPQGGINNFGYGLSPVEAGLIVGTAFLYAEAYNLQFFQANSIPPVLINMGEEVEPDEVQKFATFLAAEMTGNDGFHKPVVGSFGSGFDVKQLLKNPSDMAWKDYVEWQMRWKVALYRMSPQDIGFSLDQYKTEGSIQQQLSKNKAVNSLKDIIKQYINAEIINDYGFEGYNENITFQWVDSEQVDPLKQAQVDKIYLDAGKTSINELRARDGQDPIVGGQKPILIAGTNAIPLDPTPLDESKEAQKSLQKSFNPKEGTIMSLSGNATAIAWMDDRGVTQPLFITDYGKTYGFTVKPSFLDDRKGQEPPEAKVSEILREFQVNTPEVKIMSYDEVLKLLPNELYGEFTKWINVEAPYDSMTWRQRWGNTRKSDYYIVTGFITGTDLGNEDLQKQMEQSPLSYKNAISDLARVWLAERRFFLGDRKPGHYLITEQGNGFGVDYQFYDDKGSWERTNHFLPDTLKKIHPSLYELFQHDMQYEAKDFGVEKSFKGPQQPDGWTAEKEMTDIERHFAERVQKKIYTWYTKAVGGIRAEKRPVVRKSNDFNPSESYITNGEYVYQNGKKYPLTVIDEAKIPTANDLALNPADYREAFDTGVLQAQINIKPNFPDISIHAPEIMEAGFARRANLIADTVNNTLKASLDKVITDGIDQGMTYGELSDKIQQTLGVDPNDPSFPKWRAERIGRTEAMYATNEGMRLQYKSVGVKKVDIDPAMTACTICIDATNGNPYTLDNAEGILPLHPNCRCVLVGDYSGMEV